MSAEETETPDVPEITITPVKPDPIELLIASLGNKVFESNLDELPISIKEKDGSIGKYKIRELDGDQRAEYVNFQASMMRFGPDGKPTSMKYIKEAETKLACMSLIGPDGKLVSSAYINKLPGKLLKSITSIAARISGLDDKAEERAKNS